MLPGAPGTLSTMGPEDGRGLGLQSRLRIGIGQCHLRGKSVVEDPVGKQRTEQGDWPGPYRGGSRKGWDGGA